MNKKEKVIVTGGAGFIGSNLVDALVDRGYDVHIIDNLTVNKPEQINKKATLHKLDICNLDLIAPIFTDTKFVFHLAALPKVQYSIEFPVETDKINVQGTLNVLEASRKAKVSRVIYSASAAVYGDQVEMPLRENMPPSPKSPYGLQKYIGEVYCKAWYEVYGLNTVSLRYFNVYGPRQSEEGAYALVIAKFLAQKRKGDAMTITGDGEQTRDFTHVRDVVNANILAATSEKVGKGEVMNIGGARNVSVNWIAGKIGGPIVNVPARMEPHDSLADISLAKKLIGWEPTITLEEGIAELV